MNKILSAVFALLLLCAMYVPASACCDEVVTTTTTVGAPVVTINGVVVPNAPPTFVGPVRATLRPVYAPVVHPVYSAAAAYRRSLYPSAVPFGYSAVYRTYPVYRSYPVYRPFFYYGW